MIFLRIALDVFFRNATILNNTNEVTSTQYFDN